MLAGVDLPHTPLPCYSPYRPCLDYRRDRFSSFPTFMREGCRAHRAFGAIFERQCVSTWLFWICNSSGSLSVLVIDCRLLFLKWILIDVSMLCLDLFVFFFQWKYFKFHSYPWFNYFISIIISVWVTQILTFGYWIK